MVLFCFFCLFFVNCFFLIIKVIYIIWLIDISGNIKFGFEYMYIFILVLSYCDLYSGIKLFFLYLGLFCFVDKLGSIFYDFIFLFLNFIFYIIFMVLIVDVYLLYRCLVLFIIVICFMWMLVVYYGFVIWVVFI